MQVRRFLHRAPVTISERATLRQSAELMAEEGIGALVVAEAGALMGIVTERDLICAIAEGNDLDDSLRDVVVLEPFGVDVDASVDDAAEIMRDKGIRHLLVTNEGRLWGVLSIRDMLAGLLLERESETSEDWLGRLAPLVDEKVGPAGEEAPDPFSSQG